MTGQTRTFDLALVAGRRPDLLARTLESFGDTVFPAFRFDRVIANIDPFCGTADDGRACADLIRARFPDALISMPDSPGFAAAVMRLWQSSQSDILFHLEDDWLALEPITPAEVEAELTGDVAGLTLMCATKNTRNQRFQTARRIVVGADGTSREVFVNAFSTSPGFMTGDFARRAAALMRPEFDPEKQFYRSLNPALEEFAFRHRCKFAFGKHSPFMIRDIGRDWQRAQGLVKSYDRRSGRSVWSRTDGGAV